MVLTHTAYRQNQTYKERIRAKFNYTCQLCGKEGWIVDHIIPWAISHDSSESNLRVLCHSCNLATRRPQENARMLDEQWLTWVKSELEVM